MRGIARCHRAHQCTKHARSTEHIERTKLAQRSDRIKPTSRTQAPSQPRLLMQLSGTEPCPRDVPDVSIAPSLPKGLEFVQRTRNTICAKYLARIKRTRRTRRRKHVQLAKRSQKTNPIKRKHSATPVLRVRPPFSIVSARSTP